MHWANDDRHHHARGRGRSVGCRHGAFSSCSIVQFRLASMRKFGRRFGGSLVCADAHRSKAARDALRGMGGPHLRCYRRGRWSPLAGMVRELARPGAAGWGISGYLCCPRQQLAGGTISVAQRCNRDSRWRHSGFSSFGWNAVGGSDGIRQPISGMDRTFALAPDRLPGGFGFIETVLFFVWTRTGNPCMK